MYHMRNLLLFIRKFVIFVTLCSFKCENIEILCWNLREILWEFQENCVL